MLLKTWFLLLYFALAMLDQNLFYSAGFTTPTFAGYFKSPNGNDAGV